MEKKLEQMIRTNEPLGLPIHIPGVGTITEIGHFIVVSGRSHTNGTVEGEK